MADAKILGDRRCVHCGADISFKRSDASFCGTSCRGHYVREQNLLSGKLCHVHGCNRPAGVRGSLCEAHYMRQYKTGSVGEKPIGRTPRKEPNSCGKRVCPVSVMVSHLLHYERNKAEYISRAARRASVNHDATRRAKNAWKASNPAAVAVHRGRRRSIMAHATPAWLTEDHWREMNAMYAEAKRLSAETGVEHHVDHIVPLNGKVVNGLHVPWNLRVLPATDNLRRPRIYRNG